MYFVFEPIIVHVFLCLFLSHHLNGTGGFLFVGCPCVMFVNIMSYKRVLLVFHQIHNVGGVEHNDELIRF